MVFCTKLRVVECARWSGYSDTKMRTFDMMKKTQYQQFKYGFPRGATKSTIFPRAIKIRGMKFDLSSYSTCRNIPMFLRRELGFALEHVNRCKWVLFITILEKFPEYVSDLDLLSVMYIYMRCEETNGDEFICPDPCRQVYCGLACYSILTYKQHPSYQLEIIYGALFEIGAFVVTIL